MAEESCQSGGTQVIAGMLNNRWVSSLNIKWPVSCMTGTRQIVSSGCSNREMCKLAKDLFTPQETDA